MSTVSGLTSVGMYFTSAFSSVDSSLPVFVQLLNRINKAVTGINMRYLLLMMLRVLFLFNILIRFFKGNTLKLLYKFAAAGWFCLSPKR